MSTLTDVPIFIVPYVVEEPGRQRTFTREMEKAAILCLSEGKRKKPGILGGASEELDYIAKFHYPLWGFPWEDKCIVIDGLGLISVTVVHFEVPDVEKFTEDLKRSIVSYSIFRETLKNHGQTFSRFTSTEEKIIDALVAESPVLRSLLGLINQAEKTKEISRDDMFLVLPKFSREEAAKRAESLIGEWRRLQAEVRALEYAIKALEEELGHHRERISIEIEQMTEGYEKRISRMRKPVEKRVRQLMKEKERETEKATLRHEKKLKEILKEEDRLGHKIEELKRLLETQQKRRKNQKRKYPKRSTTRIDRRIELYKQKLDDLSKRMSRWGELKKQLRIEGEETISSIKERYLGMVAKEMDKLEILEQSRNLEVSGKREIMREIEDTSSTIEAQIKQLMAEKANHMRDLEAKALSFKVDGTVLIGIPFYIVQYNSAGKTRIDVYPPIMVASYDGIVQRIKRTILSFSLESRIQLLLNSRYPELNDGIFNVFKEDTEVDPALREGISQIGKSRNFLELRNFRDEVTKGLIELEAEGWLNAKEKESILNIYVL